ncbi:MAG: hypothetical protein COZ38_07080 [Rhodocyclales bacterium CG_4_10_14_3_um_filter_68_10]|nr:MAG: hypothetical protein COZ38_07080 [Rhodocyclales bacterium CG_4_10_14_3_um_filter_68_10]
MDRAYPDHRSKPEQRSMWFIVYYVVAIAILILHFTGFLARHNIEWLIFVLALTVFPAVIYL